MGSKFQNVLCDEYGIGGDGEYCGDDNDAQLDCINVFYYQASVGINVPRAVFFDLEPGVIDAVRASALGELFCPVNLGNDQGRCQVRSDLTSRPRPDLRSYLFTYDLT
jgi:tubulin beta